MPNLWDTPDFPHKGWKRVRVEDLNPTDAPEWEVEYATCEMCQKKHIRYVHTMKHPRFRNLDVGSECASKMTNDYVRVQREEDNLKNKAARLRRWLRVGWTVSTNGNQTRKRGTYRLLVAKGNFGGWRYAFTEPSKWVKNPWVNSREEYDSEVEAKLALLDELSRFIAWRKTQTV